jgi:hypothetical protein
MVRTPVDAVDDGVGRAFQLVVQAALDQSAKDRLCGLVAMKRVGGDVGLAFCPAHRPVHRLDDVAAHPVVAQGGLEAGLQGPLCGADLVRPDPGVRAWRRDQSSASVARDLRPRRPVVGRRLLRLHQRDIAERSVETGPALGPDLVLQRCANFLLARRSQLQCDSFRRAGTKALAD